MPLNKRDSKHWHAKMAFHYNCWNVGRFTCNDFDFHRDCHYDRQNEAYSKMLYIPPVFPDGDYVLGWTWYGGGVGFGHFGDYYDCAYVRVSGGEPVQESYIPKFSAGGGSTYEDGCEATVDDLGICWREPCRPMRKTKKRVPAPFKDGKTPQPILSEWYGEAKAANPSSVELLRILLLDAREDRVLDVDLDKIVHLNRNDEISLMAETTGEVEYVEWHTNGKVNGKDYAIPYTIAGDHKGDVYPWMHPLFNRRMRVAVKVVGKDGTFSWGNVELRFKETWGEGAKHFPGQSVHDYLEAHHYIDKDDSESNSDPEWITEPIADDGDTATAEDSEAAVIDENTAPNDGSQQESSSGSGSWTPTDDSQTTSGTSSGSGSWSSTGSSSGSSTTSSAQPVSASSPVSSSGGSSASTGSGASVGAGSSSSFSSSLFGSSSHRVGSKRGRASMRLAGQAPFTEQDEGMHSAYMQLA